MCNNCDITPAITPEEPKGRKESRVPPTPVDSDAVTVFRGGAVYTCDPQRPWAEAVVVRGHEIVAVGSDSEVCAAAGDEAHIIDLGGRMIVPGFVEGHIHPLLGGFLASGVDLQVPTREEALAAIANYARNNPDGPVRGFGWRVDMFGPGGPHRRELDEIIPDRPALMFAIDGHSLWVNSKALEIAGVSSETPDPVPGFSFFTRDESGEPTGFILETPALLPVAAAVEPLTKSLLTGLFRGWAPQAAAAGITAMFDAGVPPLGDEPGGLATIYTDLESAGELPFRVVVSHLIKAPPIDDAVAETLQLSEFLNTELVRGGVLKILGDGTVEGHTACMLEPYSDMPESCGLPPFSDEQWQQLVTEADAAGVDVHIHALGDRTARSALDAIEAAIRTNPDRDRRHTIAHLQFVDDADLARFGQLGVIAQFSANWFAADPATIGTTTLRCGSDRLQKIYRLKEIMGSGGMITFGSDWPAAGWFSTYKPLDAVEMSITRQMVGSPDAPVLGPANERITLDEALHANTINAARQLRLDHLVGSIEPGKLADLVVLADNLFEVEPHRIAATRIDLTMMNGRFTHSA